MLSILNLFGRSPFAPLQKHMEDVSHCVHLMPALCNALEKKNFSEVEKIVNEICDWEQKANLIKNDIRNHLPKSLFLPIDRMQLLEILSIQDHIADKVKDAAVLTTLKPMLIVNELKDEFSQFVDENIATFNGAHDIIKEMQDLVESSFGGLEAQKVRAMVDEVAHKEHKVDLIQHNLVKKLYSAESQFTFSSFYQWQKFLESIASISNLSESLANRIRMTLEIK